MNVRFERMVQPMPEVRLDIHRDAGYARLREMLDSKAGFVGKGK
jgi:hypothetical protein